MKAVYVPEPHKLEIKELPDPRPIPGQVLVRVRAAGICGSDMHIYHGSNALATYPRIVGHEFAGEVVESLSDAFGPGDRVSIDPVNSCGHCYPCSIGRHNVCASLEVFGVHRDGGMAELVCVPEKNAHKIPSDWSWERGALVEPFSIAANVLARAECTCADKVLVMGAGPIGLTMIQAAAGLGAQVAAADIVPSRLESARRMGAALTIDTKGEDIEEAMLSWTRGEGVPLIIDAACIPSLFPIFLRMASPAGRIVNLGFSSLAADLSPLEVTRKELTILGSRLNRRMFPQVIEWFERGIVEPERLISHRFHFEKAREAFDFIQENPVEACKVLLTF